MSSSATQPAAAAPHYHAPPPARHIFSFVFFSFVIYLAIGLPLATLPAYVHLHMGFSAMLAGLVISTQSIATFISRPWAGHISDRSGAKISVLWGMAMCTASGGFLLAAPALHRTPWLSFSALIASRLVLGVGESLGSTGATLWGISSAGPAHTARVISYNGVSTFGGLAVGAPLGVVLLNRWGLASIGWLTILISAASFALALRKAPVPVIHGEHLPFKHVLSRVVPHGMGLALGGLGYSVLATFVTLYYASRHWSGAALCLTAFGTAFIVARLLFIHAIDRYGGFPVAIVCLTVESLGTLLLWRAPAEWVAFAGAALAGFGYSLVFPALGVEAVRRVPVHNRGTALGIYTVFSDVSFFLVGPVAGAIIGVWGYASAFLFAFLSVLGALGIAVVLWQLQHAQRAQPT
ncbi:MAG: MFS transporter [Terracidiphilus sp.]